MKGHTRAVIAGKVAGSISIESIAVPEPSDYQALARIIACSICNGTDSKIVEHRFPFVSEEEYPGILGHESVGRIVRAGNRARNFKEGDLVLRPLAPAVAPFNTLWGGFAEYGIIYDEEAMVLDMEPITDYGNRSYQQILPPEMDPREATVIITLKETMSMLINLGAGRNHSVLVLGTGPVGLAFAHMARCRGARPVIIAGRRQEALDTALAFGADETINMAEKKIASKTKDILSGNGVDFIIDAIGKPGIISDSSQALAPGGKIGLYATMNKGEGPVNIERKDAIPAAAPREAIAHKLILNLISEGKIDLRRYITHVLGLGEISKAFELIEKKQAIKVVIDLLK